MKIIFTNDHAATEARPPISRTAEDSGHEIIRLGHPKPTPSTIPTKPPKPKALIDGEGDRAIMACGSGIGIDIVANRFPHVRCAMVTDEWAAKISHRHNDANCLAIRARRAGPRHQSSHHREMARDSLRRRPPRT